MIRLLFLSTILFVHTSIFCGELAGCNTDDVLISTKIVEIARTKNVSAYQRWLVEDTATDASYCARLLSKLDYCAVKSRNIQRFKDSVLDWYRADLITTNDTSLFLSRVLTYKSICSPVN